ncbi:MAG: radical SAM protein, partial [Pseudomonadota bacterium]
TLDHSLSSKMEPRAASPTKRLQVIKRLSDEGIPVSVLIAPIIPSINDNELEEILDQSKEYGAIACNYLTLRLPHEVEQVFLDWLQAYFPMRANKIKNKLLNMHEGELYKSEFGTRMRGRGEYAELINSRFKLACKKLGFKQEFIPLRTDLFQPHLLDDKQMSLF